MTAADPRDVLVDLVAKWRKQAEADQKRANDLRDRCDLEVAALRLGYATVQRECADELEQALAHARPEAVDGPHWSTDKPVAAGVYGVRGFSLGREPEDQFEAVVLVREKDGELRCNLHESTSNEDVDDWAFLEDMSDKFEWCKFNYATLTPERAP